MNLFQKKTQSLKRDGITLIEVLTSITVAVIGVAGVLILIPFATRQANVGLDLDDSSTLAANVIARFEIEQYNRVGSLDGQSVLPWVIAPLQPNIPFADISSEIGSANPIYVSFFDPSTNRPSPGDSPLVQLAGRRPIVPQAGPMGNISPSVYFLDPLWLNSNLDTTIPPADVFDRFLDMFFFVPPPLSGPATIQSFGGVNIDFNVGVFQNGDLMNGVPPFLPIYASLLDKSAPFIPEFLTAEPAQPIFVPNTISQALATKLFVSGDNLQFASDTDQNGFEIGKLDPPRPFIDVDFSRLNDGEDNDGDGTADNGGEEFLRRQTQGDITWSAVAIPRRIAGDVDLFSAGNNGLIPEGFDFHILVYKNRSFEDPSNFSSPESDPRNLVARVHAPPPANPNANTCEKINANGDSITLNVLDVDVDQPGIQIIPDTTIRNDEWLMLINYDLNGAAQVGFFRVVGSLTRANELPQLLIDGPSFILHDTVDNGSGTFQLNRTATYAIYLKDVVNVYKRQLRLDHSE